MALEYGIYATNAPCRLLLALQLMSSGMSSVVYFHYSLRL